MKYRFSRAFIHPRRRFWFPLTAIMMLNPHRVIAMNDVDSKQQEAPSMTLNEITSRYEIKDHQVSKVSPTVSNGGIITRGRSPLWAGAGAGVVVVAVRQGTCGAPGGGTK